MKNNADALIFHTAICAEAPQIALITETKQHLLILSRGSYAALRNGVFYEKKKWSFVAGSKFAVSIWYRLF